jgi:hypothetical protein
MYCIYNISFIERDVRKSNIDFIEMSCFNAYFVNSSLISVTERLSIEQGTGSFSEYLSDTSDISSEILAFLSPIIFPRK